MSATIIQGYGVESRRIDLEITRKTIRFQQSRGQPIQVGSSSPVIEFLAGRMDWSAVESVVKKQKTTFPIFNDQIAMGLAIHDLDRPDLGAVAFRFPVEGDVTPAVILRVSGNVWNAVACVLKTEFLASSMIAKFNSQSVAALLGYARDAFTEVLREPTIVACRLRYLRETNDTFLPDAPDKRSWTIASHWPDWQRNLLGHKARNFALQKMNKGFSLTDGHFRRLISDARLKLSDKTDDDFLTE